jgi:hypothetical protein
VELEPVLGDRRPAVWQHRRVVGRRHELHLSGVHHRLGEGRRHGAEQDERKREERRDEGTLEWKKRAEL